DILLFLDADNTLDPTYLERGLPLFAGDRRIAIVYPDLQAFGDESGLHVTPDWDPVRLARGPNFADAGALVTRQSLLISGALEGEPPADQSHADWRMWQRVAECGFVGRKHPVPLLYRKHAGQMMKSAPPGYFERAGLANAEVTIFTPLSGRVEAWEQLYEPWLRSQTWPRAQCRLVFADTSQDAAFHARIRRWALESDYPDVRVYKQ